MTYQKARAYIEDAAKAGILLGLDSIKNLLNELDNPQDDLKFVHIAGTNGKGSVLAYISTIMEIAGYKTGRYISPTVQSYRERIQVNRTHISKNNFSLQLSKIKIAIDSMRAVGLPHPSVFEIETALGFLHFKEQGCDIVVMETGMGGVSDATNIIQQTLVSVFTSVSRDHMEFLGDTIADLTRAKAGIVKKGGHIVYGKLPPVSEEIIKNTARHFRNPIYMADPVDITFKKPDQALTQKFSYKGLDDITIHLLGKHQIENATLAIEAIRSLQVRGFDISDETIKTGLAETRWFARLTVVKEKDPVIILDGAHNQDAIRALGEALTELFPNQKIVGVMGVFKDKEIREMLDEIKPVMNEIHTISLPDKKRATSADELRELVLEAGIKGYAHKSLANAMKAACRETDVVVAFGSLSYLGDVLSVIRGNF